VNLSRLRDLLGTSPVRSEITYLLVGLDKEYLKTKPNERWENFYAARFMQHLSAG
jgi:hypothetical protein